MSESEDKPEPTKPAALHPRPASPSAVDSDWDALLGSSSSSASDRPIFAPPGSKPQRALSAPEPTPRTSEASASVSGEFEVNEPRSEPAIPSQLRTITTASLDHESEPELEEGDPTQLTTARLHIVPRPVTLDDEDGDPPSEHASSNPGSNPGADLSSSDLASDDFPSPELQRSTGSRKLLFVLIGVAAIASVALLLHDSREQDQREPTAASELDRPPSKLPTKATPPRPTLDGSETTSDGEATSGTETGETGDEPKLDLPSEKPKHVDPRDPSLIPPGTPEENAKAFLKLPVSIHDGPPIGGIGRSGVHIDEIATARGRENTTCEDPTQRFSVSADDYVNVCFRVVHPREQETLRVIWEKDGKVTRRGKVRIPDAHAYTTRAYLLMRPEYVGSWRVRIMPEAEDSIDLAVASFSITE